MNPLVGFQLRASPVLFRTLVTIERFQARVAALVNVQRGNLFKSFITSITGVGCVSGVNSTMSGEVFFGGENFQAKFTLKLFLAVFSLDGFIFDVGFVVYDFFVKILKTELALK